MEYTCGVLWRDGDDYNDIFMFMMFSGAAERSGSSHWAGERHCGHDWPIINYQPALLLQSEYFYLNIYLISDWIRDTENPNYQTKIIIKKNLKSLDPNQTPTFLIVIF